MWCWCFVHCSAASFFGPSGLILGPLVAALLVTLLEICQIEFKEELD